MRRFAQLSASCLLGVTGLSAQVDGIDAAKAEVLRAEAALQAARAAMPTKPTSPTPPEPPKRVETSGLRAAALTFDPVCRPRRLAPGGQGTLTVVVALAGNHVLLADGGTKFTVVPKQGAVAVGTPVFRSATNKERRPLAPAMKSLPVYDDTAVFDVPLQVDADAEPGKQKIAIELSYTLYDGQTARPTHPYTDRIEYEVVIAPPVVESAPAADGTRSSPSGGRIDGAATTEPVAPGVAQGNPTTSADPGAGGIEAAPIAGGPAAAVAPTTSDEADAGAAPVFGSPVVLVAGAAAVLGLVGLLLARRR